MITSWEAIITGVAAAVKVAATQARACVTCGGRLVALEARVDALESSTDESAMEVARDTSPVRKCEADVAPAHLAGRVAALEGPLEDGPAQPIDLSIPSEADRAHAGLAKLTASLPAYAESLTKEQVAERAAKPSKTCTVVTSNVK